MVMNEAPAIVHCDCHGSSVAASVCGHLANGSTFPLGFVENSSDPDDLQGWCYACEYVFLQEEDRTAHFRRFTNHSVVCSECYRQIKAFHSVDP